MQGISTSPNRKNEIDLVYATIVGALDPMKNDNYKIGFWLVAKLNLGRRVAYRSALVEALLRASTLILHKTTLFTD